VEEKTRRRDERIARSASTDRAGGGASEGFAIASDVFALFVLASVLSRGSLAGGLLVLRLVL